MTEKFRVSLVCEDYFRYIGERYPWIYHPIKERISLEDVQCDWYNVKIKRIYPKYGGKYYRVKFSIKINESRLNIIIARWKTLMYDIRDISVRKLS
jgi:hypothetical protein